MMSSNENTGKVGKVALLVLFVEKVSTVISSHDNFAGIGCIKDVVVVKVN